MKIKTFGQVDQRSLEQLERCMQAGDAEFGVLCADHHPGYSQPIGGAVAYEGYISPSGCGFDIGCGNKAARTDLAVADLEERGGIEQIMREITRRISFGMGVPAQERADHPVLDRIRNAEFRPQRKLHQLAASQLGTVGSGNHFVNLFEDEESNVWIGVHFGSRGFGHRTASGFLALAQGLAFDAKAHEGGMDSPPVLFEIDSELGQSYIEAMQLAGEYAYAGRDVVVDKVLKILGADATYEIHNHHNFCVAGTERVPTVDGYRSMNELQPGDGVFAFDEREGLVETRVVDAWKSGSKPIYTIETRSRRIRVSADHPVLTVETQLQPHPERPWHSRSARSLVWKRADELSTESIVVCADAYVRGETPIGRPVARFVGAFLGDGWVRHSDPHVRGYTVGLAIGEPGASHTRRYLHLCRQLFPVANWRIGAPGTFGISCSSRPVHERVRALGIGARSKDRALPDYALRLPLVEKLELLAGYIDADGSVASSGTNGHGRATFAGASAMLASGLRELAISAGLKVTKLCRAERPTNFGSSTVYRWTLDASDVWTLDLWNSRKRASLRPSLYRGPGLTAAAIGYRPLPNRTFAERVRSITIGEAEDVYDVSVEHSSHSFVCEGIVVHNCWREEHFGRTYWVVRKGCTPAQPGQEGFVGASMGDESVIVEGVAGEEAQEALFSTVHGAGRVMSRTQAAGRVRRRKRWACRNRDCTNLFEAKQDCPDHPDAGVSKVWIEEQLKPGKVDWAAVQERLREQGIVLVGGGADEAPEVYKRLPEVLAAHAGSTRVKHRLRPLGVAMAGRDVYDPYKD